MPKGDTIALNFTCEKCKRKNYSFKRNKKKKYKKKINLKKYCRFCKQHTLHKESK